MKISELSRLGRSTLQILEVIKALKAAGIQLGRPQGPGKSKLDKFKEEIVALLRNGARKNYVAERYETTSANLSNWLKKNKINAKPVFPKEKKK